MNKPLLEFIRFALLISVPPELFSLMPRLKSINFDQIKLFLREKIFSSARCSAPRLPMAYGEIFRKQPLRPLQIAGYALVTAT